MAQLITSLNGFPNDLQGGAVAVGNFDGVHRGHAELIGELVAQAKRLGGPAIVLTFDPPPAAILFPQRALSLPLTSIPRRAELLGRLGVDALVAYPTDEALLSLSAEEFFRQKIVDAMGARAMVEGPNFRFGRDRAGDTLALQELCGQTEIELRIVQPELDAQGTMISSTRIRNLLSEGDIAQVNALLTQPYQIDGWVVEGARRGRDLGFPTANLARIGCLIPRHGVYAGVVRKGQDDFPAAVNIGPNPTFDEQEAKVEIHIVGWNDQIYGERLECTLVDRIRDVQKFDSVDALRSQLAEDIAACQRLLSRAST